MSSSDRRPPYAPTWVELAKNKSLSLSLKKQSLASFITCGTKIGYCGPKQKIFISGNLPSATNDPDTLTANLERQIVADRLTEVSDMGDHFISSPLSLAPKSNGKWRRSTIYRILRAIQSTAIYSRKREHLSTRHMTRQNKKLSEQVPAVLWSNLT